MFPFSTWLSAMGTTGKVAVALAVTATSGTGIAVAETVTSGDMRVALPETAAPQAQAAVPVKYRAPDDNVPPRPGEMGSSGTVIAAGPSADPGYPAAVPPVAAVSDHAPGDPGVPAAAAGKPTADDARAAGPDRAPDAPRAAGDDHQVAPVAAAPAPAQEPASVPAPVAAQLPPVNQGNGGNGSSRTEKIPTGSVNNGNGGNSTASGGGGTTAPGQTKKQSGSTGGSTWWTTSDGKTTWWTTGNGKGQVQKYVQGQAPANSSDAAGTTDAAGAPGAVTSGNS